MRKLLVLAITLSGLAGCADVPTAPRSSPSGASFGLAGSQNSPVPIPGKYIVRFKDTERDVAGRGQSIERLYGATVERTYSTALKGVSLRIADAAVLALKADPYVVEVEQDAIVQLSTVQAGATWGIDRIDQRNLPLSGTYTYFADGSGVTVYIIDTGINFTHNEYAGRAFTGIDEITSGGTAVDCNGHGSHVSGTVGGTTYGVAKNVKLVAVRVLDCSGSGSVAGVIAGIDWVALHRTLPAAANMSLGGGFSSLLNQSVQNAIAAGVVFAVAAGNSTADACQSSPSSVPNGITVGATDISDRFAFFSNFGSCVHINAPGVGITSAWIGSNTATNTISGTSMATPHVTGAVALYLQQNPGATPAQVRSALTGNATSGILSSVPGGTPNLLLYTGFITGSTPPVARFTASCAFLACSFDASSSSALAGATYNWTFGDGATASGKTSVHTYGAAGTYSVMVTVTDANGTSTKSSTVTVKVDLPPVANFTANCVGLKYPNECSFDASSSTDDGKIVAYQWSFPGDGNNIVAPLHRFPTSGPWTVTLTVTDDGGLSSSITKIVSAAGTFQPPTATITAPANNAVVQLGSNASFAGSATDPQDGTLTGASLVWTSSINGPIGTGTAFSTSTLSGGTHVITLTATDSKGLTGTATVTLIVNRPPTAAITAPANNASVVQGASVAFAGTGSDPEDGPLTGGSLVWTSSINGPIGTGTGFSTSTLSVGTHTITLTATDSKGATGTAAITITVTSSVGQPPVASFTANCVGQKYPHVCSLDASSSTSNVGIASYLWTWTVGFIDGNTLKAVLHNFQATGQYPLTLMVTDINGLTSSITKVINVP